MQPSKKIVLGLMLLFLTACGTPSLAPDPQIIRLTPDPAWTQAVPVPIPQGRDNGALAAWAKALRESLEAANTNLTAIRLWAEEQ